MDSQLPIVLPDIETFNNIRKELGEDPQRLETQMDLFKKWLRCENHLPNDVDEHLIKNFLRLCKCDLEKAKTKFEKFLAARINLTSLYTNRVIDENYFKTFPDHRHFINSVELTPDGYRVVYLTLPKSVEQFDFYHLAHFVLLLLDFALLNDTFAGAIVVYDLETLTVQHLAKVNIKTLLVLVDLIYNIYPFRLRQVHFLNVPSIAIPVIELGKKIVSDKLAKRIVMHRKPNEIAKYIPENILPEEFGGKGKSLDLLAEINKSYLLRNQNWSLKIENLKFTGPVPANKEYSYTFDEFQMEGSFRKLDID